MKVTLSFQTLAIVEIFKILLLHMKWNISYCQLNKNKMKQSHNKICTYYFKATGLVSSTQIHVLNKNAPQTLTTI